MTEAATRSSRTAVWIVLPIAVAFALLIVLLATGEPASERAANSTAVGRLAPLIEGEDLDGQWFDIDDHRGQWVVVNFFSTTCVPCIVEHPELVAFAEERAATGDALVVSVAFDDSSANVRDFFLENGGEWPVITRDTGSIAVDYGVTAVPESYLVAPSGVVAAKLIGGITKADLDNQIEDLLLQAQLDAESEVGS
ncbi:MAG: TlpA disulfide reductase family protein [Actinomycetota bacterium]